MTEHEVVTQGKIARQFIRMAEPFDPDTGLGTKGDPDFGSSQWRVWNGHIGQEPGAHDGELWWYTPADVMQWQLTDQMRDALNKEQPTHAGQPVTGSTGAREGHPEATDGSDPAETTDRPSGTEERAGDGSRRGVEQMAGQAEGWRWNRVEDAGWETRAGVRVQVTRVVWAVDNRPAITAWTNDPGDTPPPKLVQFVLPDDLVQVLGVYGPGAGIELSDFEPRNVEAHRRAIERDLARGEQARQTRVDG